MVAPVRFKDDEIVDLDNDIHKIQASAQMYIGNGGSAGAFHLGKEGVNNAIDECTNVNSPGDEIAIFLDETSNEFIVTDNGRGFPFDKMKIASTTLQSSGKFGRAEGVGGSAGQNGVGITAENALSESFEIISHRYGERASIRFEMGEEVQPVTIKKIKDEDKHGTTVKFIPSRLFLGNECQIDPAEVEEWLFNIAQTVPDHVGMTFSTTRKGKDSSGTKKFRRKEGMATLCKDMLEKKAIIAPVHLMGQLSLPEEVATRKDSNSPIEIKMVDRQLRLEFAFTYQETPDPTVRSFCNHVWNIEHGTHEKGTREGLVSYLVKQTREALSEKEAKKLTIETRDAACGLVLALYLSTDMSPHFGGQTKDKVNNPIFIRAMRDLTIELLAQHFRANPKELKRLTDHIKTAAKVRLEANKVRSNVYNAEGKSGLGENLIDKFAPANNKGKNDYRELFIVEGDSAFGPTKEGRYSSDNQAVFGVRGYGLNSFDAKEDRIQQNNELRTLISILKTDFGKRFNIKNLAYRKIIILTDSDADGGFIFSLLCAFFIKHMPEIVEGGFLYKAVAPLYQVKDKKKFVLSYLKYVELFEERIGDNIRLADAQTNVALSKKEFEKFLLNNRNYLDELRRIAGHYRVNPILLEFIITHQMKPNFPELLKKTYPEMSIDKTNVVEGIFDGAMQILNVDKLLHERTSTIREMIFSDNGGKMYYRLTQKTSSGYDDMGIMSIGEIMFKCQKYRPGIEKRFKGLGELNSDQLLDTTLDPNRRMLIQMTADDLKKELETFEMLHGKKPEARQEFLSSRTPKREEIDN